MVIGVLGFVAAGQVQTGLPGEFVKAADEMVARGVPDTRGLEVRWAVVKGAFRDEFGVPTKTIGWVLPYKGLEQRRIVGTNGMVYEVEDLGERVNVDQLFAPKPHPQQPNQMMQVVVTAPPHADARYADDFFNRVEGGANLFGAALLYRSGNWATASRLVPSSSEPVPYLGMLTDQYLKNLKGRLVYEFADGDLSRVVSTAAPFMKHREFFREAYKGFEAKYASTGGTRRFEQFDLIAQLSADAERRTKIKAKTPFNVEELKKLPVEEQVKELIDRLEDAKQDAFGNGEEPAFANMLSDIGDPAVEPLLTALAGDKRMSRVVRWGGSVEPGSIMPVWEVAAITLLGMLDDPPVTRPLSPQVTTTELLNYWKANRKTAREQRWVDALASDDLTRVFWGARLISMRADDGSPMLGIPVSEERREQINGLFSERLQELAKKEAAGAAAPASHFDSVLTLHEMWAKFDEEAASKAGKWLSDLTLQAILARAAGKRPNINSYRSQLGRMTVMRMHKGDTAAAADYLKTMSIGTDISTPRGLEEAFRPLILFPENPEFKAFAERAFRRGGPWAETLEKNRFRFPTGESRMLAVASYRERVSLRLHDATAMGRGEFNGRTFRYSINGGGGGSMSWEAKEPDGTTSKVVQGEIEFRVQDMMAQSLAQSALPGAPEFRIYWPRERRDKAVMAWILFLEARKGDFVGLFNQAAKWPHEKEGWDRGVGRS